MDEVAQKQDELKLAELSAAYDEAVEAYRGSGSDQDKATKDDLAEQVVAARQALRQQRESDAAALSNGEGVARPTSVEGSTEVSK